MIDQLVKAKNMTFSWMFADSNRSKLKIFELFDVFKSFKFQGNTYPGTIYTTAGLGKKGDIASHAYIEFEKL